MRTKLVLLFSMFAAMQCKAGTSDDLLTPPPEYTNKHVFVCEMDGEISHAVLMVRKIKDFDSAVWTLELELPGKPQYAYYHQVEGEVCFSQLLEFPIYFKMIHPDSVESQRTWK